LFWLLFWIQNWINIAIPSKLQLPNVSFSMFAFLSLCAALSKTDIEHAFGVYSIFTTLSSPHQRRTLLQLSLFAFSFNLLFLFFFQLPTIVFNVYSYMVYVKTHFPLQRGGGGETVYSFLWWWQLMRKNQIYIAIMTAQS